MRNPIQLTTEAFGIMSRNMRLFLSILAAPIVLSFIAALFMPTPVEQVAGVGFSGMYMVMMLLSGVVNVFMGIALILVMRNMGLTAMDAYKQSTSYFLRYLGMSIVMMVLLFVGFLLLIIPGIILAVWLSFSAFVLVLENGGMIGSLKQSREYVRGHWWGVLGRLLAMGILLVVVSMVFSMIASIVPSYVVSNALVAALAMLLAPFSVAYMYLMYQDLKGGAPAPQVAPVTGV